MHARVFGQFGLLCVLKNRLSLFAKCMCTYACFHLVPECAPTGTVRHGSQARMIRFTHIFLDFRHPTPMCVFNYVFLAARCV